MWPKLIVSNSGGKRRARGLRRISSNRPPSRVPALTFSTGISMPRSPRATMMPSVASRISSKLCRPAAFSILEMILTCQQGEL